MGGGGGGEGHDVQNQALLLSQALPGVAPQVDLGAGSVSCLLPFLTLSSALQPPEPMTRLGGWWLTDQSRGRKHSFLARQVWLHVPALPLSSSMTRGRYPVSLQLSSFICGMETVTPSWRGLNVTLCGMCPRGSWHRVRAEHSRTGSPARLDLHSSQKMQHHILNNQLLNTGLEQKQVGRHPCTSHKCLSISSSSSVSQAR